MNEINFYCKNDDYFNFENTEKTKASIYIFKNNAKLCLQNNLGSATYCVGNTSLIFREYMKNWYNCPIDICLGLHEKEQDSKQDIDGDDFLFKGHCIAGKYQIGKSW